MDREGYNRVLERFPYGLFVIGSVDENSMHTMIATWVTQVSFDPPLVAAAIESDSRMRAIIDRSHVFSVNILPAGRKDIAKAFVRPRESKDEAITAASFDRGPSGTPLLREAAGSVECKVVAAHATGDHVVYVGEVVAAVTYRDGGALTLKETGWRYRR